MNSLSWFLYAADAIDGLRGLFMFLNVTSCLGIGAYIVLYSAANEGIILPKARWFVLAFVLGISAAMIPTKTTMYAIAASEFGERLANTEQAKIVTSEATRALQSWIKRQIDDRKDSK